MIRKGEPEVLVIQVEVKIMINRNILIFICFLIPGLAMSQESSRDYEYALIEAVKQKNLGNIPGAIELYKVVLKENDNVAAAHYELGSLLALLGDLDAAETHLKKAYNLYPDVSWYFDSYIEVLVMEKNFKEASKLLLDRIDAFPQEIEYKFQLANLYFRQQKGKKALKILDNIEDRYGLSDKVVLLKASIYESEGDFKNALVEVEKIIDFFPESVDYYVVAAELATKSKQKDLAADFYLKVMDLDSTNIFAITNLTDYFREKGQTDNSLYYLNKSFSSKEIDYDKKMAILSYYLSDDALNREHHSYLEAMLQTMMETYPEKRDVFLFATDFFIQGKDFNKALDALMPVLVEKEKRYALWKQGIVLANYTGRNQDLFTICNTAISVFPDSADIYFYKGIAEFELNKFEMAIHSLGRMDSIDNISGDMKLQADVLIAESYNSLGQYTISDSLFRFIIKSYPANYVVMNNFGYYLSLRGESLEEAKQLSYETVVNNPGNATYLDTFAWILYKMGNFTEAEYYISQALDKGGNNDPDVNEHAAEIHISLGSVDIARAYLQKALILGGEKEKILNRLKSLDTNSEN